MQNLKWNNKFAKAKTVKVNRQATAQKLLQMELEKLPVDERLIVERFISRGRVARNIMREFDAQLTFGERLADRVAVIGGSWKFCNCTKRSTNCANRIGST